MFNAAGVLNTIQLYIHTLQVFRRLYFKCKHVSYTYILLLPSRTTQIKCKARSCRNNIGNDWSSLGRLLEIIKLKKLLPGEWRRSTERDDRVALHTYHQVVQVTTKTSIWQRPRFSKLLRCPCPSGRGFIPSGSRIAPVTLPQRLEWTWNGFQDISHANYDYWKFGGFVEKERTSSMLLHPLFLKKLFYILLHYAWTVELRFIRSTLTETTSKWMRKE